jgi:predicted CopG family antitoxin
METNIDEFESERELQRKERDKKRFEILNDKEYKKQFINFTIKRDVYEELKSVKLRPGEPNWSVIKRLIDKSRRLDRMYEKYKQEKAMREEKNAP